MADPVILDVIRELGLALAASESCWPRPAPSATVTAGGRRYLTIDTIWSRRHRPRRMM